MSFNRTGGKYRCVSIPSAGKVCANLKSTRPGVGPRERRGVAPVGAELGLPWAERVFGKDDADKLRSIIKEALTAACVQSQDAQDASRARRLDPFGHSLWPLQFQELADRIAEGMPGKHRLEYLEGTRWPSSTATSCTPFDRLSQRTRLRTPRCASLCPSSGAGYSLPSARSRKRRACGPCKRPRKSPRTCTLFSRA